MEAVVRLGVKKDRVFGWVRCRLIIPAGSNEYGVRVYYLEHMQAICDLTESWQQKAA
jgi:hypothetical protein